ncbi:hypothetical protein JCM10914A_54550 [Paenibacillus sp. JCM 10914]|uniref:hypothetical protein n=1 Tax=Paenibacillus sp. JCM 10914 TaxID=1236974 RepID=UPI0003CCA27E|nr:hypothetical protein [Paenibacillus sp. JCM 10914]GAE04804.1 hypothetical protein JCM10914_876 [Paenibacillus sp. JCM 10914]
MGDPWIYIVLLGVAAVLYAFMLPKRREETVSSQAIVQEVENTLEGYMAEIQHENEQLVELIGQLKREQQADQQKLLTQTKELQQRVDQMERQLVASEDRLSRAEEALLRRSSTSMDPVEEEKAIEESTPDIHSIKHRYAELFDLYEQGKSIDMIAKATELQRGEVQLIIQLAKQEESA